MSFPDRPVGQRPGQITKSVVARQDTYKIPGRLYYSMSNDDSKVPFMQHDTCLRHPLPCGKARERDKIIIAMSQPVGDGRDEYLRARAAQKSIVIRG